MSFTAITFVDNSAPSVCAANLNYIEQGITDATATADAAIPKSVGTTAGDTIYFTGASTPVRLGITNSKVLTSAADAPSWGTVTNTHVDAAAAIAYSKLNLTGGIVNADVAAGAAIAKSKLAALSVTDSDVAAAAAIAYSKLNLSSAIVNADIAAGAAVAYSKLNLAGAIVNADVAAGAAIAKSKLAALSITDSDVNSAASICYLKLKLTDAIVNADIKSSAAIAYSKLNLATSIVNADIAAGAAVAYSKLNLVSSIGNADIAAGAAVAYSKLNLATSIVNADVAAGAAIAYSKLNLTGASIVSLSAPSASLVDAVVKSSAVGTVPATLVATSGQTADILRVKDGAAVVGSKITNVGAIVVGASGASSYLAAALSVSFANTRARNDTFTVATATDTFTSTSAHKLGVNETVYFTNSGGGLPSPLNAEAANPYYVISVPTLTTFKVSTTVGGTTVDITTTGTGTHTWQSYSPAGTEVIRLNKYGDIIAGDANFFTWNSADFDNEQHWYPFAYLATSERIYTRSFNIRDLSDSPDLNSSRAGNGSGPNVAFGSKLGLGLGVHRWFSSAFAYNPSGYASTDPMVQFVPNSQSQAAISAEVREDCAETAGGTISSVNTATDTITTSAAHNLLVDAKINFTNTGGALPGGLSAGTNYWVLTVPTGTTFTLSTSSGGPTKDLTSGGSGTSQVHSAWFTTGGAIFFKTTPTGLTSLAVSSSYLQPRMSIRPAGAVVVWGAKMDGGTADGFGVGDLAAEGDITAGAKFASTAGYFSWLAAATQTTVGAAGAATALPANPTGYAKVQMGGTVRVIPYYAAS